MNKKIILGIIICGIIFGSVGVYAGSNFYANGISVSVPTGSSLGSDATLQNSLDELYNIADKYDELKKEISSLKSDVINEMYPVGSIYFSTDITSPSDVAKKLGGTWISYGASDTYLRLGGNGSGGSNSVKLSANQIPTHTTGNQSANHSHTFSGTTSGASVGVVMKYYAGDRAYGIATTWPGANNGNYGAVDHTHTFSGTTKANNTNHTHTYTNNNQQNVSINPKYVQVYAFKRTA